jgi:hypothetical protein
MPQLLFPLQFRGRSTECPSAVTVSVGDLLLLVAGRLSGRIPMPNLCSARWNARCHGARFAYRGFAGQVTHSIVLVGYSTVVQLQPWIFLKHFM